MTSSNNRVYRIWEDIDETYEIQELSWSIDINGNVSLEWEWPGDSTYKMAVVFEVNSPEDTLMELVKKKARHVVVTKSMGSYYNRPINKDRKRFKVFPARFGEGNEIIIANQKDNNCTDEIIKKIRVDYNVSYHPVRFSEYQRVSLHVEAYEEEIPQKSLVYEKYAYNRLICRYPLENTPPDSFFYIRKYENIKLKAIEGYKDIIEIKMIGDV